MSLDSQVVAARIHLRVCELRLPAAVTAVQLARGKTSSRPAPRPVASPATAAWRYPSPPAPKRISLEWEQRETFLKLARLWAAEAQRVRKEENGTTLPFIMPRREAEMSRRDRSSLNQHVEARTQ